MSLRAEHITFGYSQKNILQNVGLEVQAGEMLALLGPNGTGKTTLLKCICRILEPKTGTTVIDGQDISPMSARKRAQFVGYVPQNTTMVFPGTVADTVMTGRMPYVGFRLSHRDKETAFSVLEQMDLHKFAFQTINQLSGGERQRVFIARALAQEPRVLLLDEPTSSLDLKNQLLTLQIIRKLVREKQLAAILSIHDLNLAAMFCDKILILRESAVFAYGECREVITEHNIESVYGVKTAVSMEGNVPHIRLLPPP